MPAPALTPASDEVDVWIVDLRETGGREDALSPDERRRAASYRREEDRRRFVGARQVQREVLARYVDAPPAGLVFATRCARCGSAEHGKPSLAHPSGSAIRFSASRSGDVVAIAVAQGQEVGVDVERVDARIDHREIAAQFFGPHERDLDLSAFYAAWTRKEALLKLSGLGLAGDLAADAPPDAWVEPIRAPDGYAGAVAGRGARPRIVHREGGPGAL